MIRSLLKKFIKPRRKDVSLFIYIKFVLILFFYKCLQKLKGIKVQEESCLILFPPSLGLGDLIILSKIVDIVKSSKTYKVIKIFNTAPYLQKVDSSISFINLKNIKEIISFQTFILPSPSLLNFLINLILGPKNCKGYIYKNYVNFPEKFPYKIKDDDQYYLRLKPFKNLFKYENEIKPYVWNNQEREKLSLNKSYFSLKNYDVSNKYEKFIVLSTYNFYIKFRPKKENILNEVKKSTKYLDNFCVVILGAKANREIKYNKELAKYLRKNLKDVEIIDLSGKLSINNALEIITQSSFYIGANNGLANIAQMVGVNSLLLFNGPEKPIKRKFSEFTKIL